MAGVAGRSVPEEGEWVLLTLRSGKEEMELVGRIQSLAGIGVHLFRALRLLPGRGLQEVRESGRIFIPMGRVQTIQYLGDELPSDFALYAVPKVGSN